MTIGAKCYVYSAIVKSNFFHYPSVIATVWSTLKTILFAWEQSSTLLFPCTCLMHSTISSDGDATRDPQVSFTSDADPHTLMYSLWHFRAPTTFAMSEVPYCTLLERSDDEVGTGLDHRTGKEHLPSQDACRPSPVSSGNLLLLILRV